MKNLIAVSVLIFAFTICRAQSEQKLNLGFEKQSNIKELSDGWFKWSDYTLSIDTLCKTGKKSGKITSVSNGQFGCIAYKIPANYSGKRIVLEGYMKIKNVEIGRAHV